MISLSKCDRAGEMQKIGAFPPKLLIGELFEEEHGNYDPKLYKIKVATSIGNQSYDLQLNLTLSDLIANFKGANNITFRCDKQNKDILDSRMVEHIHETPWRTVNTFQVLMAKVLLSLLNWQ